MVVNNDAVARLTEVGLTEYEARAYIALLGHPRSTAYELAKAAGLPTSKVYEVLAKLTEKRVVVSEDDGRKRRFVGVDPDEFIQSRQSRLERVMSCIREDLAGLTHAEQMSHIWNVSEYDFLLDKADRIVGEADRTVLLSAWPDELDALMPALLRRHERGVKLAIVRYAQDDYRGVLPVFDHPIAETLYAEKGGRGLVVVADGSTALLGTITDINRASGAWSTNPGFVALAEDYIKHDVYIVKIVARLDHELRRRFGKRYELLRDVFSDRENP
jgi:HTH-type transcriptional regulator, sugar sensing transcriptional regulator